MEHGTYSRYVAGRCRCDECRRARQAAGQKGKKRGKMRWFAVMRKSWFDGGFDVSGVVAKGLSADTVTDRFRALDAKFNRGHVDVWMESEAFGPFDSEDEASRAIEEGCEEVRRAAYGQ